MFNNGLYAHYVYFYRDNEEVESTFSLCSNALQCTSSYTIPRTVENTGVWSCKVKFDDIPEPADGLNTRSLYIRKTVPTSVETKYVTFGSSVQLTCTIHGDAMQQPEWETNGSNVVKHVDKGSYDNNEWTTKLNIEQVEQSADYTCHATYISDTKKSTVAKFSLIVLKIG